jgi:predicted DCC family thiol-disulfide oxidoreductase YuxK
VRSDAAIRVVRRLGLPWSLLAVAAVVPRGVRDAVYSWIARNRYRWFGRRDACMVPTPELRARFLDVDEPRVASIAPVGRGGPDVPANGA